VFSSVEDVLSKLLLTGYITEQVTATVVYLAAKLNKPIPLEGQPGSGKTELAYAVAKATRTEVERLQCFEGINEEKAIGKFDEALQRLAVEMRSRSGAAEWEDLKRELHSENFFSAGPLLRALQYPQRCVLLIDELDKIDQAFEAQAFKRACSCFGLGRYLYYFSGIWVDLDDRKRLKSKPALVGWATPEGWRQGLRPDHALERHSSGLAATTKSESPRQNGKISNASPAIHAELVRHIEAMAAPLGKGLYRGLLKTIAAVWNPGDIQEVALLEKVLKHMQSAERGLCRLRAALEHTGPESLRLILRSLDLKTIDRVNDLATLHDMSLHWKLG
jgi:hypothetical protein